MNELRIMGKRGGDRTRVGTIRFVSPDELLPWHRLPVMMLDAADWEGKGTISARKNIKGLGSVYVDHLIRDFRYYVDEPYIDALKERMDRDNDCGADMGR